MRRRLASAAASLALAGLLAACGGSSAAERPLGPPASEIAVPNHLAGLNVTPEKEASATLNKEAKTLLKAGKTQSYVDDSAVYTLREGTELKAVLQVSRLRPDARPGEADFRKEVVFQIGKGPVSSPEKIDEILVYRREEAHKQTIFIWFVGYYMNVLIVRQDETVEGQGAGVDPDVVLRAALVVHP